MSRLKLRNSFKSKVIKIFIILMVLFISFLVTFKILYESIDIDIDNTNYIDYLIKDSFSNYNLLDLKKLSSSEFLLKYSLGIDKVNTGVDNNIVKNVVKEEKVTDPLVYIFNTHQLEGYNNTYLDVFNINNTVYIASHILKEYLNDYSINALVETQSVSDVLNLNGWKYGYSYKASRILLEEAFLKYPTLNFFIDLHRDSASYDKTMIEIDKVKYAKVMFVVGLENTGYEANLNLANNLNEKIKKINPHLSRGVLKKKGKGVNGIYNQDFSPNMILIEVGGQYNYIEEVNNTLKVLAKVIYDYMEEVYEKEK